LIANGVIGVNGVIVQKHVEEESRLLPEGNFKNSSLTENHVMEKQLANKTATPTSVQVYDCSTNGHKISWT
jgi:hypothetical protein